MYVCKYAYMRMCVCVYACACVYMRACINVCIHICVYTESAVPGYPDGTFTFGGVSADQVYYVNNNTGESTWALSLFGSSFMASAPRFSPFVFFCRVLQSVAVCYIDNNTGDSIWVLILFGSCCMPLTPRFFAVFPSFGVLLCMLFWCCNVSVSSLTLGSVFCVAVCYSVLQCASLSSAAPLWRRLR